ncbi:xylulose kinase [Peptococcaceae bacterium CEB3]|nr:xylulose kinase [Peptococcaceae bacterium CEB3]
MEKNAYLLGIDFGTSGVKSILVDSFGNLLDSSLTQYPTSHGPASSEQDPQIWWESFIGGIKKIVYSKNIDRSRIVGIGISSQSSGVVLVDKHGRVLRNAIIWMDNRAGDQCVFMGKSASIIERINGNRIEPCFPLPKIIWIKENEPDLFAKASKILTVSGYVIFKLTGCYSINMGEAGLIHLFDMGEQRWSDDVAARLDIPLDKLPSPSECSQIVGHVTKEAASITGLPAGVPVIAGGVDTASAALGVGIKSPSEAFFSMGSGGNLCVCIDQIKPDKGAYLLPHVISGEWLLDAVMNNVGSCLEWFQREFGKEEVSLASRCGIQSYDLLSQQASTSPPGSNGLIFMPYLAGETSPIWDMHAKGCFIGLSLRSSRADIIRAIMEGVCYSLRHNLEIFEQGGELAPELKVTGGPSRSKVWMQILADVTGKRVVLFKNGLGAPMGNAILAGIATGVFADYDQAIGRMIKIHEIIPPNLAHRHIYEHMFSLYLGFYSSLKDTFPRLVVQGS